MLNGSYSETVSYNGTSYSIYNNSNTNTTYLLYRANLTESKYKKDDLPDDYFFSALGELVLKDE